MPIINEGFLTTLARNPGLFGPRPLVPEIANLSGTGAVTANGTRTPGARARLRGQSVVFAGGILLTAAAAELAGTSGLFARGRLNDEPNVFGEAELLGLSELFANGRLQADAKAVIPGTSAIVARPRVVEADRGVLSLLVTVVASANAGFGDTISARVVADGVNYPIRSATYTEPRDAAGVSMQFTLQRPEDRAAILAATSFKFEVYADGVWTTLFDAGRRSGGGFAFTWVDARPGDTLEVSTIGPVSDAMTRTPLTGVTIFDGLRETLTPDEFPTIYDTDGNAYGRELINVPGLTLYDLLRLTFVEALGFARFRTDIPNYSIRRADFEQTGTYLSGVAPFIGMFEPLIFVKDSTVWILDGTQTVPAGFATAFPLEGSEYRTAQFNEAVLDADGFIVTYSDAAEFDYFRDREIIDPADVTASPYTEIIRRRIFRDFYKVTNPTVPIRTEKIKEVETTQAVVNGSLLQVHEATETINLDSTGRIVNISKEITGLVPDIATPTFPFTTRTLRSERTDFSYSPVLRNSGREFLSQTKRVTRGVIAIDAENQHLGRPFRQAFGDAFRAGNLAAGQTLVYGPIEAFTETVRETERGQLEIRARTIDYLTTPPTIRNQTTDARAGDLSTNARGGTPQQVIVLRRTAGTGSGRSDKKLLTLSAGELPVRYAIPLARRRLANPVTRTGTVTLKGVRLQFGRGFVMELKTRDGESLGNYIVEGRTVTLSNLGTREQATTQNLDVKQI